MLLAVSGFYNGVSAAELKFFLLQTWNMFQIVWIAYVYQTDYDTEDRG